MNNCKCDNSMCSFHSGKCSSEATVKLFHYGCQSYGIPICLECSDNSMRTGLSYIEKMS
jgi:hypothetical protein